MGTPIQGDNAGVMDHFVENDNVSGGLEKLKIVIVGAWSHWRSGIQPHNATFLQGSVFPRIRARTPKLSLALLCRALVGTFLPLIRHGRKPAVGRIHDQRRAPRPHDLVAAVVPKLVVRDDSARRPEPTQLQFETRDLPLGAQADQAPAAAESPAAAAELDPDPEKVSDGRTRPA
jgi:hypothetical protein